MARSSRKPDQSRPSRSSSLRRIILRSSLALFILAALFGVLWLTYLDQKVREGLEGARWSLPAKVYARSLDLYQGRSLSATDLEEELERLGYRPSRSTETPGTYHRDGSTYRVHTREAVFADGRQGGGEYRVRVAGGQVQAVRHLAGAGDDGVLRLEPPLIDSFYPAHAEDRILVRLEDTPPELMEILLTVEDRKFFDHFGVRPLAILRAALVNLRAGEAVQGGSTITQQLVKNFFLDNERTLRRKFVELFMAMLVEARYSKQEILEAYLNEVYLGQQGRRAIHGFGLASRFYFNRPLDELDLAELSLLVGIVKGPSYYNPRRHPERARQRRNLVLSMLHRRDKIDEATFRRLRDSELNVTAHPGTGQSRHPAYLDLVKEQLKRDYSDADLKTQGLRIFTNLDPVIQQAAETAVDQRLDRIEQSRGIETGSLQGAMVVTDSASGDVLAVVGDRNEGYRGFNRALNARRPIGSLVKPAVFLAALERQAYDLATPVNDGPLRVELADGDIWAPQNYDRKHHGEVPLFQALAHSYNVATARLGLHLGLDEVHDVLRRLGVDRRLQGNPASLLGTVELTPIEVARMYQTLAAGGFRTPLRAIQAVRDSDGNRLQRYPLKVEQAFDPTTVFLVQAGLREVVRAGTGRRLADQLPEGLVAAGKTGTTDDLRDSWFAGFTGQRLAVAWVGRDDNRPAGLTGSSGAMRLWGDLFARQPGRSAFPRTPDGIEWEWIDGETGRLSAKRCEGAVLLPFREGTAPETESRCRARQGVPNPLRWLMRAIRGE